MPKQDPGFGAGARTDESRSGEDVRAVQALLTSLEDSGNLNSGYVGFLVAELGALLPEAAGEDRPRGTAFNGRLVALEGEASPELSAPHLE